MPELPEVETVRRGLLKIAKGRKINAIDVYYGKTITNDVEEFRQALIGQTIEDIDRRGKYLLFRFSNQLTMVSHLRMEGQYFSQPVGAPIDKHTHVVFQFTDGTELCYHDTRKFGRMTLVKTGQEMTVGGLKTIGPEPTRKTLNSTSSGPNSKRAGARSNPSCSTSIMWQAWATSTLTRCFG